MVHPFVYAIVSSFPLHHFTSFPLFIFPTSDIRVCSSCIAFTLMKNITAEDLVQKIQYNTIETFSPCPTNRITE